ncbi:hypothetical protein DPMN_000172 [Dreissena polymorpha]|uniref:Uncharacterized protein n=1 Tax=Dreissena polymorpha TaxID=45954 RepID=A0A9D4MG89_DREPO|nr:hypothetical protein DPMN_000172 [Dreissena polymorpha]
MRRSLKTEGAACPQPVSLVIALVTIDNSDLFDSGFGTRLGQGCSQVVTPPSFWPFMVMSALIGLLILFTMIFDFSVLTSNPYSPVLLGLVVHFGCHS